MGVIGKVLSPVLGVLGVFDKPKAPTPQAPLPQATPRANSVAMDAIAARQGSAVNQRTGPGGAESTTGKKTLLGQ